MVLEGTESYNLTPGALILPVLVTSIVYSTVSPPTTNGKPRVFRYDLLAISEGDNTGKAQLVKSPLVHTLLVAPPVIDVPPMVARFTLYTSWYKPPIYTLPEASMAMELELLVGDGLMLP